jgi:outer membrane protein assembly factor BamB
MKYRIWKSGRCTIRPLVVTTLLALAGLARAADWPQWHYDAARTAITPAPLPPSLHLQWSLALPPPSSAWPTNQPQLQFDASYEPVVAGHTLYLASMVSDCISAYDTASGALRWRFFADGPVRFAPAIGDGRLFFVSDDGCLYCLDAASGALRWKVHGGPDDRRILGNDRLVSFWPARGAPVLFDGKVYFTAGIWPFLGVFLHAVDPETGRILWTNSGSGAQWKLQGHFSPAFAGVAPQGYIAATAERLFVPGGRTAPAVYDRRSGEALYFNIVTGQSGTGGYDLSVSGNYFLNGGALHRVEDGMAVARVRNVFLTPDAVCQIDGRELVSMRPAASNSAAPEADTTFALELAEQWRSAPAPMPERIFLQAGPLLYGARADGTLLALDPRAKGKVVWQTRIDGEPWSMLAADDRLWVVTRQGTLYCFGSRWRFWPSRLAERPARPPAIAPAVAQRARELLQAAGTDAGVAVVLGAGDGALLRALAASSRLHILALDPDSRKVDALRHQLADEGVYGRRIHLLPETFSSRSLPPYLANLLVTDTAGGADHPAVVPTPATLEAAFRVLRPYGGTACLPAATRGGVPTLATAVAPESPETAEHAGMLVLRRRGPLPGTAGWTHEYGDPGNTGVSPDKLVHAPLGVLWFGGPSHDPILPRHGHGPSPQIAGGRLFIEGRNMLRAVDVYTGRLLWDREFRDLGKFYDNTSHQPGAGEIGANYVSLPDAVYVMAPRYCLRLDPATGQTVREFRLPAVAGREAPAWGSIRAWQDLLVATTAPLAMPSREPGDVPPEYAECLIPRLAEWQYTTGSRPPPDWTAPAFRAAGWQTGRAGVGYGYDDIGAELPEKSSSAPLFLRRVFDLPATQKVARLDLMIRFDDGFIAYLNGQEVLRSRVSGERSAKGAKIGKHEARVYEQFEIRDAARLVHPGTNVLAIEGYNAKAGDGKFLLDPYLVVQAETGDVVRPPAPVVPLAGVPGVDVAAEYASASRTLAVFSRETGALLWTRAARQEFRHNAVVVGGGKVFCIDGLSAVKAGYLRRRGHQPAGEPMLLALDARTGRELWRREKNVFGTWLGYSEEHDALLECGSANRDRALDDIGRGMVVCRGADGTVIWRNDDLTYGGPCLLWHDRILAQDRAFELLTGKTCLRTQPLTGETLPWTFRRNYGCGTARAGEHLVTFRSAAAGFFDLDQGGTGNFGGFKSGCTANLIPADGVLNAPDYTRTCVCRYQIQASLALVPMADVEKWTFDDFGDPATNFPPIRRVGINFGAPGDRQAEGGALWLGYPNGGWPSPNVPISVSGAPSFFTRHASTVAGDMPWVAASGMEGATSVTVRLLVCPAEEKPAVIDWRKPAPTTTASAAPAAPAAPQEVPASVCTVRLHFAEPRALQPGERVFDVRLQGKTVLPGLDIVREAGGANRALVREFTGVAATGELRMDLVPKAGQPLLCGIEIVRQPVGQGAP